MSKSCTADQPVAGFTRKCARAQAGRCKKRRTLDGFKRLLNRCSDWVTVCVDVYAMLILDAARPCRGIILSGVSPCPEPNKLCGRAARPGLVGVQNCQRILQAQQRRSAGVAAERGRAVLL